MKQYLNLLQDILDNGVVKADRTGTGTISVFGRQVRYDLTQGLPVVTTKKVFLKGVIAELIWFLQGDTNNNTLKNQGVHIWDAWERPDGRLGPVYGKQWRRWGHTDVLGREVFVDQIKEVVDGIKANPDGRRHIVSAWNVADIPKMALPPCHMKFQFYVSNGKLSCMLDQRSCDMFLGIPFNIASYAILTHMVARCCNLEVGEFIHTMGDTHIYLNHIDQVVTQLGREPRPLPTLAELPKKDYPWEYVASDIIIDGYDPHPGIKAPVSV